jgi:hypothetical protein
MFGKIKAYGLALTAIVALGAAMAATARAGTLDVGATPTGLYGQNDSFIQEHVLSLIGTKGGTFNARCQAGTFEGTAVGTVLEEATVTPTYGVGQISPTGCTLFGQAAQVRMNGCKYTYTGTGQASRTFLVDIVGCTAGQQIQIKSAICTLHIPEQNGLSHVIGTNVGGAEKEVTLEATTLGITVQQTGAVCPDGNNHQASLNFFSGNTIVKAYKDQKSISMTGHGHQYSGVSGGEQVKLVVT